MATALLGVLSLWQIIDPNTASVVNAGLAGVLSLLGAGAAGTAVVAVNKQRHDGTFDPAPEVDPAQVVVNGVKAALEAKDTADRELARIQEAITGAIENVPVLGPLASEVLERVTKDIIR
jgi:malonyl CoA-acyl carrier protein transacylase